MAIWVANVSCSVFAHTNEQNSVAGWLLNGPYEETLHVETYNDLTGDQAQRHGQAVGLITASLLGELLEHANAPQCDVLNALICGTNRRIKDAYEMEQPEGVWAEVHKLFQELKRRGKIEVMLGTYGPLLSVKEAVANERRRLDQGMMDGGGRNDRWKDPAQPDALVIDG